jgi:hypothetical protein
MTKSITFHFDNPESLNEDGSIDTEKAKENVSYIRYAYAANYFNNLGFTTGLGVTSFVISIPGEKEQAVSFDIDQSQKGSKLIRFEIADGEFSNYRPLADVFSANSFGNQLSPVYFLLIVDGDNYAKVDLTTEN